MPLAPWGQSNEGARRDKVRVTVSFVDPASSCASVGPAVCFGRDPPALDAAVASIAMAEVPTTPWWERKVSADADNCFHSSSETVRNFCGKYYHIFNLNFSANSSAKARQASVTFLRWRRERSFILNVVFVHGFPCSCRLRARCRRTRTASPSDAARPCGAGGASVAMGELLLPCEICKSASAVRDLQLFSRHYKILVLSWLTGPESCSWRRKNTQFSPAQIQGA